MEIIIEEISRGQKLLHRHKYQQSRISIGRGYQNDIILCDPHVCAEHLTIECHDDENWIVEDKQSVNGAFIGNSKETVSQHTIKSGDVITLGKSQIRFIFPDHPVAQSIVYSPFESLINIFRHPVMLLLSVLLFSCLTAWVFHLNQVKAVNFTHLLVPTIGAVIVFTFWPLLVSLISFLTKNEARTLSQLGVSFLFFNCLYISDFIDKLLYFNFSSASLINELSIIIPIAIAFSLFWLNCHIGFHMSAQRRVIIASALTLVCFSGSYLLSKSKQPDFNTSPQYNAALMTPSFKVAEGVSVLTFANDTRALFSKTLQAAKKSQDEK